MNFQQLGDSKSANKAMKIEIDATEVHLCKAWKSNESYYRKKYVGWKRIVKYFEWLNFKALDIIWGNGESTYKLIRSILIVLLIMTLYDAIAFKDGTMIISYWNSFLMMPEIFLGVTSPFIYSKSYLALIFFTRIVAMGFFLSIIIKKFNKR